MEIPLKASITGRWLCAAAMLAVMVALVVYHSAYAAEMVRAGILSVSKGQTEAASSLGPSKVCDEIGNYTASNACNSSTYDQSVDERGQEFIIGNSDWFSDLVSVFMRHL